MNADPVPSGVSSATAVADRRVLHFLLGLAVSAAALWVAFGVQQARPNPFAARSWWSWFAHPSEVNAESGLPAFTGDLYGLHVSDDRRTIWLVGARRTVAVSRDAGRTWKTIALPTFDDEGTIPPKPPEEKKAEPLKSGASLMTPHTYGMQSAQPKKEVPPPTPRADFLPPEVGTALTAVSFTADGKEGWIVGTHGVLFHTVDAGESWTAIRLASKDKSGLSNDPNSFHFLAVRAMSGSVAEIADSGGCHITYSAIPNTWVHPLYGTHPTGGAWIEPDGLPWLAGDKKDAGLIKRFTAPGAAPVDVVTPPVTPHPLRAITVTSDGKAWAAGDDGTIVEVAGGKAKTQQLPNREGIALRAVAFADATHGVVGGDGRTLAFTTDGGATWKDSNVGGKAGDKQSVRAVWIADTDGWAVGTGGLLLRSADAGATWHSFTRPADAGGSPLFLPAPWLLLALLLAGWCFVRATVPPVLAPVDAIDDSLTPDRPLEPGDRDVMELGGIARALSRFLRNEKTLPPLTAAVLGKWGTGKSSLMNLLKKDLEGLGFSPVWFNAWHHSTKKEDELLAGLLANVIRQGIPPWFSLAGVCFRARLVWFRLRKIWLRLVLGVSLTAAPVAHFGPQATLDSGTIVKWAGDLSKPPDDQSTGARTQAERAVAFGLSGLAGLVLLLQAWRRGLQSFGIDAGALLPGVTSQTNLSALDAKACFRLSFATQFREVTAALNPRTLVVFIDDLDRCRPENVLEVMEAINFLSSSGDCFIVLGMDWEYVHRCVALGFEKVADALTDAVPGTDDARAKRLTFARSYLEKLINFDVPVPTPDARKREEFLLPKTDPAAPPAPPRRRFSFAAWKSGLTTAAMILGLVALPMAAYWWAQPVPPSTVVLKPAADGKPGSVGSGTGDNAPKKDLPDQPPNDPKTAFAAAAPAGGRHLLWVAVAVTVALVAVGVVGVLRAPGVVVRDSSAFTKALALWIGPIAAKRHTARSLKQFINRLRYCAARMRVYQTEPSRWDRFLRAVGLRRRPTAAPPLFAQEADLVQWSVLCEVCPAALDGTAAVPDDIAALRARHEDAFPRQRDERDAEQRRFQELAAGFQTERSR